MPKQKQKGITFGYCDLNSGQRVYPALSDTIPEKILSSQQSADLDMFANITCVPPIGRTKTVAIGQDSIRFSVLLETNSTSVDDRDVKVTVWHDQGRHEWVDLPLRRTDDLKDTTGGQSGWKWVNDHSGTADGTIFFQREHEDLDFTGLFQGMSTDLTIHRESADTPQTKLYSITARVNSAKGQDSGYSNYRLGLPRDYTRWFSLVRLWSPWLAPRQGKTRFDPDKDAVLASFLRNDGAHVVCLAVSGLDDVLTVFTHDGHGNVIIRGRNDREKEGTARVIVAVASSFEVANAAVMYHARRIVAGYEDESGEVQKEVKALVDDNVKPEWLEEWYDGFTYCTWNGLGQNLSEDKIQTALKSLKNEGITISNLIIDDNWQSLTDGNSQFEKAWIDFDANKTGFPRGLKSTVQDIRKDHPQIKHIAVWHAILGYWGGVAKDGNIAKRYKTITVEKEKGVAEGQMVVVDESDVQRMYNDFYAFLSDAGIDSVKTDAQFFLDMLLHAPDRRRLIKEYQDSWTIAYLRHFSSRAISCMSQTPQILFHTQLPTNKPRLLVRNSDDFFPEVPASHPWHIFCNAHNSLLTQHLNVLPDWDMFQTDHPWASFHGAARCVSGGPIYFTDEPGKHDIKLINQMTAETPRGTTVILRPSVVGKSMDAYADYHDQVLLRVGTFNGYAKTGSGILGIFNCVERPLTEFIQLDDFPGTEEGKYIVRAFDGTVSKPMSRGEPSAFVGVNVGVQGWDILTAHPLRHFAHKQGDISVAFLGLLGKMTGVAAIAGSDAYVEESGRLRLWISLKAFGVLGLWISDLGQRSIENDMMLLIFGKPVPRHVVRRSESCDEVLEVDLERAWKEMGLEAGWSNEISIEMFVH
ncbi:hypothetical protein AAFC00_006393 [Neodothiora populina]|uniref:Alpha-galactosidase n=1 Tax=Neodothiora populina TaxID=2781224 RepID=A0ABR3P5E2_9PEZI